MRLPARVRTAASILILFLLATSIAAQVSFDIPAPNGSDNFGENIFTLPNGNIVITDPGFDLSGGPDDVGAVHLFNGFTGALISTMTGSSQSDEIGGTDIYILPNSNFVVATYSFDLSTRQDVGSVTLCSGTTGCPPIIEPLTSLVGGTAEDSIGSEIIVLPNGNYIVLADTWDNGGTVDVGAVVFCSGVTGCVGTITQDNALIGSNTSDRVGDRIQVLSDGDYVVNSFDWDSKSAANVGAVTYCSGTTGCPTGAVSAANSLVGTTANDQVGRLGITELHNGNFVVSSHLWDGGAVNTGAATFCSGSTGCVGEVSAANSLVGSTNHDQVSNFGITPLASGNYVVGSRFWDPPTTVDGGAVTFCDGNVGCTGPVSTTNSLHGTSSGDEVGAVMALATGNYVAMTPRWNSPTGSNAGAATFCNGFSGCNGPVATSNSMVGATSSDVVGNVGMPLSNGNYLLLSKNWDNVGANEAGAVTNCNSVTGCVGVVGPSNSLVGTTANDLVGDSAVELANGNVVIVSRFASINGVQNSGAVTFCTGAGCPTGPINGSNSLFGSSASDRIGGNGILTLANGSYVVLSSDWDRGGIADAGAATLCNGVVGCTGAVSDANSLVGSSPNDDVGSEGFVSGSRYIVKANRWDNGSATDAGAVTLCGPQGCFGPVSAANSIVGTTAGDEIGNGPLTVLPNGDFIIQSRGYSVPSPLTVGTPGQNVGAVSYIDITAGSTGTIPQNTSVIGTVPQAGSSIEYAWDPVFQQIVVAFPNLNQVTVLRPLACGGGDVSADRDCDGKSDLSLFRPSNGTWYFFGSTDGFAAAQFGLSTDVPVPRDFDGDGNVDIAIFRPSSVPGQPDFYILPSSGGPAQGIEWGVPGDIPIGLDYDGDGMDDISVFRPSNGFWYILQSSDGQVQSHQFGVNGDLPLVMDYNGDGRDDLAVYRPSDGRWYIARPTGIPNQNFDSIPYGISSDIPVPADYDGDGEDDIAVFRPSNGGWYLLQSTVGVQIIQWGANGDVPVPGDYDGDGTADIAVFRNGAWWQRLSTGGFRVDSFGVAGDKPLPGKQPE
ncbi:MAG: VCBS repeat-containing protein [Acidobacteria bacterium]|nr:MAG: VCBS repeat-containing protein [Acidobacteriota bacterium]REJ97988.1 MAG: VCBS repeat-containing protein [Acidobacteriota bacterium]REK16731.1 MAG: VCBS repeat-containing protein [Acidobacteriota bacterium]REK42642.1 MAG: VCBS repeat-containing protein [Acidobacteriota bacterium]